MPNIDEIIGGARDAITVRRVYGEPIEQEGVTLVPAAAVRSGGGGGGDSEGNGGGGFGVSAPGRRLCHSGRRGPLAPGRRREPAHGRLAGRLGARRTGGVGGRPPARASLHPAA